MHGTAGKGSRQPEAYVAGPAAEVQHRSGKFLAAQFGKQRHEKAVGLGKIRCRVSVRLFGVVHQFRFQLALHGCFQTVREGDFFCGNFD
jgi:hypothetical protein